MKNIEISRRAAMHMYIQLLKAAEQAETPEEARLILKELKRLQENRRKQQPAA